MELRHLRCFIALAEELHFGRAAERLHIEQPPLSRTIKELEEELGVQLFRRNRRGTHLTQVGQVFLHDVCRIFTCLEQAHVNVRAAASGYRGSLRIAVSEGAAGPRLAALLAHCREVEPEVVIHLCDVPRSEQLRGLRDGTFDAGFSHSKDVGSDIISRPVWSDRLVAAIPRRHPLLAHPRVPLGELIRHPLLLCHSCRCEGYAHQVASLLSTVDTKPTIAEQIASLDMTLTLVAAGYGVGFATASTMAMCNHPNVIARPLDSEDAVLTTYLLWPAGEIVDSMLRFIERASRQQD
ncbi:LysR family transcriptional regulator [Cupriavidus sp. WS]|uniref:LysR family transcriptional regulator n=1 Tax=Cupriavidus sp. WS TaxID=1312922 RepID=UPI0006923B16|nr:LysR substrate-binding domain-containing protein [Cupriavidus sp. WS]